MHLHNYFYDSFENCFSDLIFNNSHLFTRLQSKSIHYDLTTHWWLPVSKLILFFNICKLLNYQIVIVYYCIDLCQIFEVISAFASNIKSSMSSPASKRSLLTALSDTISFTRAIGLKCSLTSFEHISFWHQEAISFFENIKCHICPDYFMSMKSPSFTFIKSLCTGFSNIVK